VASFLSGDWAPLLRDLACRNPGFRPPQPFSDDPKDVRASQANRLVMRNGDIGAAAAALRAPARPPAAAPGQVTRTFRLLNPQVGEDAPVIPPATYSTTQGGGALKLTGEPKHLMLSARQPVSDWGDCLGKSTNADHLNSQRNAHRFRPSNLPPCKSLKEFADLVLHQQAALQLLTTKHYVRGSLKTTGFPPTQRQ
jgi:hypothetical protein